MAAATYDFPHKALFSTELLREFFRNHRYGVFSESVEAGVVVLGQMLVGGGAAAVVNDDEKFDARAFPDKSRIPVEPPTMYTV